MTIQYQAQVGNGYYRNMRPLGGNKYLADVVHHVAGGWVEDPDVKVHVDEMKEGQLRIHKFATEEEIINGVFASVTTKFMDALIKIETK